MRRFSSVLVRVLSLVLVGAGLVITPSFGQGPQVGDTIVLVERDLHIPAHPGPGITSVSFRFTSGSTAEVLAVDEPRGWLLIRGEQVQGGDATGWITSSYVASIASRTPTPWWPSQRSRRDSCCRTVSRNWSRRRWSWC